MNVTSGGCAPSIIVADALADRIREHLQGAADYDERKLLREAMEALTRQEATAEADDYAEMLAALKTWPEDIRRKLSCHDLRRMGGWRPMRHVVDREAGLWCMHIEGPDDVHPAPSKADAQKAVVWFNERFPQTPGVLMRAVVAPWPHSAESHAESAGSFIEEWLTPQGPQGAEPCPFCHKATKHDRGEPCPELNNPSGFTLVEQGAEQRQEVAPSLECCWLLELFVPHGGASMGFYHTGFTDIGYSSRTTQNPHEAKKYASKDDAEAAASRIESKHGVWRAIEHGFYVDAAPHPAQAASQGDAVVIPERPEIGSASAVMMTEACGWEYQHGETGRMTTFYSDGVTTREAFERLNPRWLYVGPLYRHPQAALASPTGVQATQDDCKVRDCVVHGCQRPDLTGADCPGRCQLAQVSDAAVVVDKQGVRFGRGCWLSHEKITGWSAATLNNRGGVIVKQYMDWVDACIAQQALAHTGSAAPAGETSDA